MVAYLFPGQGSQHKGMGRELFDEFEEFTVKSDQILGYSIKKLCLEDPDDQLNQTQYTQPALYIVNALNYLKKLNETGIEPDFVAGHSLGEYDALFAAGVFDFETGVKLVKRRGELMGKAYGGAMAAVMGLREETVRKIIVENELLELDVANSNTPTQIVISGPQAMIDLAKPIFEAEARSYVVLKVSGAFHSRYMEGAKLEFMEYARRFEYKDIKLPVISNVYARPYKQTYLIATLAEQITNSVKWTESIRYLMGRGVKEFIQIGPGNVINGLVKAIKRDAEPLLSSDAAKVDNRTQSFCVMAESLGSTEFKKDYGIKYAYLLGAMYKGVASKELVVRAGKAGLMGFLGSGGLDLESIEEAIKYIQKEMKGMGAYGVNFLHNFNKPQEEERLADIFLRYGVRNIEASAFITVTPALVRYRLKGLRRDLSGRIVSDNKIIAKVSRPEVAENFLSPAPGRIVDKLLADNLISQQEALLAKTFPMADDLCVETDSGGHTDGGVAYVLMPAMLKLRDDMMKKYKYDKKVRVGAAGGIGTPSAVAAAFLLGADFVMTGSVNQCTVEAGTSSAVKDLLQQINVQDTAYAPAGDMFEIGAKIQVLKRGLFFPIRAARLFDLYQHHNSLDEIDDNTRTQLQQKYFKRSFDDVYKEVKAYYGSEEIEKAEKNPKHKMALIFRWYFGHSTMLALNGSMENKVDYQVHCGPALGAFNQLVKGTALENWTNRHVDEIGIMLMSEAAEYYNKRILELAGAV